MLNPNEKTIPGQTVTTDVPAPAPTTEPKKPGRVKAAFKHPIETAKRHKTALAVTAGVALGAVAATLLSSSKDENSDDNTDAELDALIAQESNEYPSS
jgi:hypothetical protein